MARKGILSGGADDDGVRKRERPAPPSARGAVGALQSSLARLQENAIQEIDPKLIDAAGIDDRLGVPIAAQEALKESIAAHGQQVPVLVRPHARRPGRYEIVYGRRRVAALKALGLPVKAMVRQMDDRDLTIAQGQENNARQDLSFVEKASFAAQLDRAGYDRATIAAALAVDAPMISRMLKVGHRFSLDFLRLVGPAPGIGRERWLRLAALFEDESARSRATQFANRPGFGSASSDERFEAVLARAEARPPATVRRPRAAPRAVTAPDGTTLGEVTRTAKATMLTVPGRDAEGFAAWLDAEAEAILRELHERWSNRRREDRPATDKGGTTTGR